MSITDLSLILKFIGEKGGVGKSLVSLSVAAFMLKQDRDFIVCEADRSNGDVGRAFEGKHKVIYPCFVEDSDQIERADELLDAAEEGTDILVNTPAQSHRAIAKWLSLGSADLAIAEGVKFCFFFVTSGEQDSVSLFLESLQEFDKIPHVLVRNQYFTDRLTYDYSDPETWPPIKEALEMYKVPVINFPRFAPADIDYIRAHSLTFDEAMARGGGLNIAARSRILRALTTFFTQLESLGIFNRDQSTTTGKEPSPTNTKRIKANNADGGANGDAKERSSVSSDGGA